MEQRRLRPGDSLDDYCPRERRLTDHIVVAVVDEVVKQTRCSACDTEHPYKEGKVPARRTKKEATGALYERVLEDLTDETSAGTAVEHTAERPNLVVKPERKPGKGKRAAVPAVPAPETPMSAAPPPSPPGSEPPPVFADQADEDRHGDDEGPVHRRLIRATLPRPEGQVPARPLPEFTMRQIGARGAGNFSRGGKSNRFGRGGGGDDRFAGPWNGRSNGHGGGNRNGNVAPGAGDGRGRPKGGRSRGQRAHHKKTR